MRILVTGAAGFIGNEVSRILLEAGETVYGLDNLNDYYEVSLKEARLARLKDHSRFHFAKMDIADHSALKKVYDEAAPDIVVHLAAQAGVRYSVENPHVYVEANVAGLLNLLECARARRTPHFLFASSSSVYGARDASKPFSVDDPVDHPISLYAATKRSGELMAHSYSHLFGLPITCLRFFTVYGPWGRPDMALFKFTSKILRDEPIEVYNHGKHKRDFTFIDDIVSGILLVLRGKAPSPNAAPRGPAQSTAPFRIYNIGRGQPVELMRFIEALEKSIGKKADCRYIEAQSGDVDATWADVSDLHRDFGYAPQVSVEEGVDRFVRWYREYYAQR
ncbi:MAG: SDR family NAD(P)-dependent oxidoreductase [Oligoflexia bacterium]|nr:SDR family NAD(P)-dependent oxidoreductase [Oligoflexia bacterium]